MSSPNDSSQGNLKRVLRTAFIGVSQADRIMIKGYLRVLLRLETDLDWVSANHHKVDLFIINNEFRNASRVKNLLSKQSHQSILYVSRTEDIEGRITGDNIILPLKQINELDVWLTHNLPFLRSGKYLDGTNRSKLSGRTKAQNLKTGPQQRPERDNSRLINTSHESRVSEAMLSPSLEAAPADKQAQKSVTAYIPKEYASIIQLMQQLYKKPSGLFKLTVKGKVIATIEPSSGRLWQSSRISAPKLTLDWRLIPYKGPRSKRVKNGAAQDLHQWLWECAWRHPNKLLVLVSDSQQYQLHNWIKPDDCKERRELLRIMTVLKTAPRTVAQLATLSNTSKETAKKAIAGLLLSGSLRPESYEALSVNLIKPTDTEQTIPNKISAAVTSSITMSNAEPLLILKATYLKLSSAKSILARRETGGITKIANFKASKIIDSQAPSIDRVNTSSQQQKKSLLIELRSKLGL